MPDKSYLTNADPVYIDHLYEQYKTNNESVDFGWRKFFEGFDMGFEKSETYEGISEDAIKEINVLNLIHGYRQRGHLFTETNPVRARRTFEPTLALETFGLSESDLEKTFNAGIEVGIGPAKLSEIIDLLRETYCGHIGVEYIYMRNPLKIKWLQDRVEKTRNRPELTIDEKRHFLYKLNQATVFENFLHTKYIGQKRFSVEGLECLIPALDAIIQYGAGNGVEEFVLGMAHRGRLNVLANIFNKTYTEIFSEFEGNVFQDEQFEGDVKYHLGYNTMQKTKAGTEVEITLAPNPSHLEAVNPIVKGMVRSKLDHKYNGDVDKICPILMHGDAAASGQGIMYEIVQMSGLDAYNIGGTIHVVTNNQIGFTTNYTDGRTSTYCTDVAKVTLCPVLHVNGDDVEAVVHAVKLAMAYRLEFNSDVFIDLLGYRKYGHNEGDEPRFTQPLLYKLIEKHPNPREIYKQKLLDRGEIDAEIALEMEQNFKMMLQGELDEARNSYVPKPGKSDAKWSNFRHPKDQDFELSPETGYDKKRLLEIANAISTLPEESLPIKKVQSIFRDRLKMIENNKLDWAMGELLAYSTLLDENHPVRLVGQDVERGTFSHRHAVVKKEDSEAEYIPLNNIKTNQPVFSIYNSLLSEYAALGYEYGYSMATPEGLTIWEAQFGDFANGAQIIIDQFICCSEAKWGKYSGLTLLLPHGYEGQGPEHSSARLERFLQLCASNNMQVCNITSPANMFHALRRQLHRDIQLPLVVMTPKSLLRHPMCVSTIEEMAEGHFMEVIDDQTTKPEEIRKVLLCSGKIYYDLAQFRETNQHFDVAIVRLEQLFPLPLKQLKAIAKKYANATITWVQEEPRNMGAWSYLLQMETGLNLSCISRKSSPSTATGFKKVHDKEQAEILKQAFS